MAKKVIYVIRDKEAGNIISWHDNFDDALQELFGFEAEDIADGKFTEDFYEIAEIPEDEFVAPF